jgi:hypothetical protein
MISPEIIPTDPKQNIWAWRTFCRQRGQHPRCQLYQGTKSGLSSRLKCQQYHMDNEDEQWQQFYFSHFIPPKRYDATNNFIMLFSRWKKKATFPPSGNITSSWATNYHQVFRKY